MSDVLMSHQKAVQKSHQECAQEEALHASPLGKASEYKQEYDPGLLCPIQRQPKREALGIHGDLPFQGRDLWYAYELSWLTPSGKPVVRVAQFELPCYSECLIESKSFKLYLNSFNQSHFASDEQVRDLLEKDLSKVARALLTVTLMTVEAFQARGFDCTPGVNLDHQDVAVDCYQYEPDLLSRDLGCSSEKTETINTHLLKSNCPVTGQPDWGTLVVSYQGDAIDHGAFLKYICSFRNHQEFHEQCVERVFMDLQARFSFKALTVYAQYLRRGGLDINPWRSTLATRPDSLRFIRQ
ncbi:MAG: NADPH-dependent 7-cyano-7-deazaguanine reductase QueF [Endozoicomonas sp.]